MMKSNTLRGEQRKLSRISNARPNLDRVRASLLKEIERTKPTTIWDKFRSLFVMSRAERKLQLFETMVKEGKI